MGGNVEQLSSIAHLRDDGKQIRRFEQLGTIVLHSRERLQLSLGIVFNSSRLVDGPGLLPRRKLRLRCRRGTMFRIGWPTLAC